MDQKKKVDHENLIFHYSSEEGRKFLTAAYAENARHKKGKYGNHEFVIEDVFTIDLQKRSVPIRIQQTDLMIRAGGGLYENESTIVDILLYSPFTNRYEVIRATQYPCENRYYTDIFLFRSFLKKYGNPGVCLSFFQSNGIIISSSSYSFELREESILKCYGYNVNKKDGYGQDYRQKLLAEIVDFNILSVSDIIHHIEWCIDSHSSPCFSEARWKWKQDLHFISNYRVCPERFLIVEMNTENNDAFSR